MAGYDPPWCIPTQCAHPVLSGEGQIIYTCCMCSPSGVCCAEVRAGICNGEIKHTPDFDTDFVYFTINPLKRGPPSDPGGDTHP